MGWDTAEKLLQAKDCEFGWSRADRSEAGRKPSELAHFLISAQSLPLTLQGLGCPTLEASDREAPAAPVPSQPLLMGLRVEDLLEWGLQKGVAGQQSLFWPVLHPYLATNLKSGSPFGFLMF